MHLTLIHTSRALTGRLSRVERQGLSSVLWGWLSLACAAPRSALQHDPRGAILDAAIASIDRGTWLQDVAVLPPMVLSAVRTAAMLAHLPDTRLLRRWLRLNATSLYIEPDVEGCRDILRLNATLEGVSGFDDFGFDDGEPENLQAICKAMIRFHCLELQA